MNENQYIVDYYSGYDEDNRLVSKSGSVEFLTTKRYIEKYIKPGDRIIEVGAGTGRYSHALAQQGYNVDAVELVEHNIEVFKANTKEGENISIRQGNALDLSAFPDNAYDISLLLGPMYHLYTKEDKLKALREIIRITKPGGVIFVAYVLVDLFLYQEVFKNRSFNLVEYIEEGKIDPVTFATKSAPKDLFELVRKQDIDALMAELPVTRLHYVITNGLTYCMCEAIDEMDDELYKLYLDYHFSICEREDLLGMSNHSLDVFRK